jgi:hypothetical protein
LRRLTIGAVRGFVDVEHRLNIVCARRQVSERVERIVPPKKDARKKPAT